MDDLLTYRTWLQKPDRGYISARDTLATGDASAAVKGTFVDVGSSADIGSSSDNAAGSSAANA